MRFVHYLCGWGWLRERVWQQLLSLLASYHVQISWGLLVLLPFPLYHSGHWPELQDLHWENFLLQYCLIRCPIPLLHCPNKTKCVVHLIQKLEVN